MAEDPYSMNVALGPVSLVLACSSDHKAYCRFQRGDLKHKKKQLEVFREGDKNMDY